MKGKGAGDVKTVGSQPQPPPLPPRGAVGVGRSQAAWGWLWGRGLGQVLHVLRLGAGHVRGGQHQSWQDGEKEPLYGVNHSVS